jgi:UDP-N-acetylmuramoyl-L-alanyl-D-glutamate--2,6-diaminopimelate ligase
MKLEEVVKGMIDFEIIGDPTQMINGLSYDSRCVKPGNLFIALRGHGQDGHDFFGEALSKGAVALVGERFPGIGEDVTKIRVPDSRVALSKLAIQYYRHVIMEVSSHALDQKRTEGCPFKVAIFTNFTRDHLDYHRTMEDYFRAKSLLFRKLARGKTEDENFAVLNMDDSKGEELAAMTHAKVVTYGLKTSSDVRAESISADKGGLTGKLLTPIGERSFRSTLIGEMNIYNILSASAAAVALNIDLDKVVEGIESLHTVPGRLAPVPNPLGLTSLVDYAHTPDALKKALRDVKPLVRGRLITVFGCGGDRDKGKRFEMGLVAGESSDLVFITSDNPRSEKPLSIMRQIEKGVQESGLTKIAESVDHFEERAGYIMEADRRLAIRRAVSVADEKDLVLIAGKGHEDYQIVGVDKRHFDDREEAALAAQLVERAAEEKGSKRE